MLKRLVPAFILLSTSIAYAQNWVPIGKTDVDNTDFYVESSSIKKVGGLKRAWVMQNLSKPDDRTLSRRLYEEFDCNEDKFRIIQLTGFDEGMGKGKILFDYSSVDKWSYPPPGSMNFMVLKFVCKK